MDILDAIREFSGFDYETWINTEYEEFSEDFGLIVVGFFCISDREGL